MMEIEPKELRPIFAADVRDALAYALAVCARPTDRPNLAFVAIIPDRERHRFLVTARNGSYWVGAWVDGDGMHRIALPYESAKLALKRLRAECSIQEAPQLVPDGLSRRVWYVASERASAPVSVDLEEFHPRWDVSSKLPPPTFPTGWDAPRVAGTLAATPVEYSSGLLALGRFWDGTTARWWIDVRTEMCRVEFTRRETLVAFAVGMPWGRIAGVDVPDARQVPLEDVTAPPPASSAKSKGSKSKATTTETQPPAPTVSAEAEYVEIEVPEHVSAPVLAVLVLAHAFRTAGDRSDTARWLANSSDELDKATHDAGAAFWKALGKLADDDKAVCTKIVSDANLVEQLVRKQTAVAPPSADEVFTVNTRDPGSKEWLVAFRGPRAAAEAEYAATVKATPGVSVSLLSSDGTSIKFHDALPKKPKSDAGEARP